MGPNLLQSYDNDGGYQPDLRQGYGVRTSTVTAFDSDVDLRAAVRPEQEVPG